MNNRVLLNYQIANEEETTVRYSFVKSTCHRSNIPQLAWHSLWDSHYSRGICTPSSIRLREWGHHDSVLTKQILYWQLKKPHLLLNTSKPKTRIKNILLTFLLHSNECVMSKIDFLCKRLTCCQHHYEPTSCQVQERTPSFRYIRKLPNIYGHYNPAGFRLGFQRVWLANLTKGTKYSLEIQAKNWYNVISIFSTVFNGVEYYCKISLRNLSFPFFFSVILSV